MAPMLPRVVLLAAAAGACTAEAADRGIPEPRCADGKCDADLGGEPPRLCAAVRGNGQLIYAHFASLARISELYGPVDAMAGGSSASLSTFVTESISLNPAIYRCGDGWCDRGQVGARTGFLFKSLQGYAQVLAGTDEALAMQQLAPIAERIRAGGIEALAAEDAPAARDALVTLLSSPDLRDLINPEVLELLAGSPDPEFHVREVIASVTAAADFQADSDRIFFRPGILDFRALADKVGRLASFYAGYGPADDAAMTALLDACAEPGRGAGWDAVARMPAGGSTCGAEFARILSAYRAAWAEGSYRSRADDHVGQYLPALISTSVLTGATADSFASARADYVAARPYQFEPRFAEVRFGYWGHPYDLAQVAANPGGFDDAKTARFESLGAATWRTVLSYSPAEPGLARALEIDAGRVSAGGWSDLAPVLVLRNLGCQEVVYVTRRGEESNFARGVARQLGMADADDAALFDLDRPSAFRQSVDAADAAWCTDWNSLPAFPVGPISANAYSAPLITESDFFADTDPRYAGLTGDATLRGCSPSR